MPFASTPVSPRAPHHLTVTSSEPHRYNAGTVGTLIDHAGMGAITSTPVLEVAWERQQSSALIASVMIRRAGAPTTAMDESSVKVRS
ncbi:hypothetical protein GCM10009682_15150 [Luedemannella flava]|uniref:Uncharacterized protein n=1 Tax=Luedemannella flava TaxID=349316 RepID=A0ABN2LN56_9ACTN